MNGVPTNFIGFGDLIINKEKAGGDQDLLYVKRLKERNKLKQYDLFTG